MKIRNSDKDKKNTLEVTLTNKWMKKNKKRIMNNSLIKNKLSSGNVILISYFLIEVTVIMTEPDRKSLKTLTNAIKKFLFNKLNQRIM